jgi:hypothetical protein
MLRYKLRTLLIVLALGPMVLAWYAWPTLDAMINPPSKLGADEIIPLTLEPTLVELRGCSIGSCSISRPTTPNE